MTGTVFDGKIIGTTHNLPRRFARQPIPAGCFLDDLLTTGVRRFTTWAAYDAWNLGPLDAVMLAEKAGATVVSFNRYSPDHDRHWKDGFLVSFTPGTDLKTINATITSFANHHGAVPSVSCSFNGAVHVRTYGYSC